VEGKIPLLGKAVKVFSFQLSKSGLWVERETFSCFLMVLKLSNGVTNWTVVLDPLCHVTFVNHVRTGRSRRGRTIIRNSGIAERGVCIINKTTKISDISMHVLNPVFFCILLNSLGMWFSHSARDQRERELHVSHFAGGVFEKGGCSPVQPSSGKVSEREKPPPGEFGRPKS